MSQYRIFNGENWIDAAVIGPKGEKGSYYKPFLKDGYLSMTLQDPDIQDTVDLGNIRGPQGYTGYGYNANFFDNWDFTHAAKRGIGDNLICDRWYSTGNLSEFDLNNGLVITQTEGNGIKQSFPYISAGNYIFSIVTNTNNISTFEFKILNSDGTIEATAKGDTKEDSERIIMMTSNQPSNEPRYIHYATLTLPNELLSSGTNYPSVVISLKGSNIIIYRAKMEANIYRPNEQKKLITPTIEQEIMQDDVLTKLIIRNSNAEGIYTSPFVYVSKTITSSLWTKNGDYYEAKFTEEEAKGDCHLIVTSHPDSFIEWSEYNIICSNHDPSTGKITMRAVDKPSEDIKVNILVVKY